MSKQKTLFVAAGLAMLLSTAGLAAQSGAAPEKQPPAQPIQKAFVGPHITGTVISWNGDRMDLKTREGKEQQVAINERTERLTEIRKGAEVTVDYRRKIGKFVIAKRVRPAETGQAQAQAQETKSLTGEVVSSNQAELLLRTGSGDVAFFLSPSTRYLVRPLGQGLRVTVEYREVTGGSKMAVSVSAEGPGTASGSAAPNQ